MKIEGYWYNDYSAQAYPMPVPNDKPFGGKDAFLSRLSVLENKAKVVAYRGYSPCRLCSLRCNGSTEYVLGGWVWPAGYKHYIKEHNVIPSDAFMDFVMNNKNI